MHSSLGVLGSTAERADSTVISLLTGCQCTLHYRASTRRRLQLSFLRNYVMVSGLVITELFGRSITRLTIAPSVYICLLARLTPARGVIY